MARSDADKVDAFQNGRSLLDGGHAPANGSPLDIAPLRSIPPPPSFALHYTFFFFFLSSAAFLSFPFQCFFLCFFSLSFLFSRYATTTGRGTILDGRKRNGVDSAVTRETWSMRYLLAVKVAWKRLSRVRGFSPSFRRKNRYLFFAIFAESLDLNFSFFSYSP